MTFFLLGYAVGLKEKIKTVMRAFMICICIFVFYTSVTHAQTTGADVGTGEILVLDSSENEPTVVTSADPSHSSEITEYIDRLLAMQKQTKWKNSPAFSAGNYAFFEGFNKQLGLIPSEDHDDMIEYTLKQINALTNAEATKKFNIQKGIIVAVLTGIKEMVENDSEVDEKDNDTSDTNSKDNTVEYTSNSVYKVVVETVAGVDYHIYKLNKPHTIKYADFHDDKGSFVSCMYSQCNSLNFSELRLPKRIFVQYTLGEKNEIIDLSKNTGSVKKEVNNDDYAKNDKEDNTVSGIESLVVEEKTTTKSTTTTSQNDDTDLLQELSDIFGGAF